jgi:hypothetical protein
MCSGTSRASFGGRRDARRERQEEQVKIEVEVEKGRNNRKNR